MEFSLASLALIGVLLAAWTVAAAWATLWAFGKARRAEGSRRSSRAMSKVIEEAPAIPMLVRADGRIEVSERLPAWRRVVAAASTAGLPVPGLAASLAWFDSLTTARGSANLIQAQRDFFGSHTYERVDRPGAKLHTDWPGA